MTESQAERDLPGIKQVCWGPKIKPDIFRRWSQGFFFSQSEPTALEQSEGGPCGVIAPVQAFILKNLLQKYPDMSFRDEALITDDTKNGMLIEALCEILGQAKPTASQHYYVVYLNSEFDFGSADQHKKQLPNEMRTALENGELSPERQADDSAEAVRFHDSLRVHAFVSLEEVRKYLNENVEGLKSLYSILLFLYSVIVTRGLELVKSEITRTPLEEPELLITLPHGYGSQSITNLMLTGGATCYVHDEEKDVDGIKLKGLEKQSKIGFLTYEESRGHIKSESFYKNPIHPVWVIGSETHLTVLFSPERKLARPETKADQGRRIFRRYDCEGNNFIKTQDLPLVLQALELFTDAQYLEFMKRRLDPETLGIILLKPFMEEFFQKEPREPDTFLLYHYNGLAQSNPNGQIRYHEGNCILLEQSVTGRSENQMLTTLQTKWKNIEVRWSTATTPSLN